METVRPQKPSATASTSSRSFAALLGENMRPPYVLVGHSLGGLYMQLFARQPPQEVAALILVDSTHPKQLDGEGAMEKQSLGFAASRAGMRFRLKGRRPSSRQYARRWRRLTARNREPWSASRLGGLACHCGRAAVGCLLRFLDEGMQRHQYTLVELQRPCRRISRTWQRVPDKAQVSWQPWPARLHQGRALAAGSARRLRAQAAAAHHR
jgi:pimeloyl-ACP methyl ester carboxylesterase